MAISFLGQLILQISGASRNDQIPVWKYTVPQGKQNKIKILPSANVNANCSTKMFPFVLDAQDMLFNVMSCKVLKWMLLLFCNSNNCLLTLHPNALQELLNVANPNFIANIVFVKHLLVCTHFLDKVFYSKLYLLLLLKALEICNRNLKCPGFYVLT